MIALVLALTLVAGSGSTGGHTGVVVNGCHAWSSSTTPPRSIRVRVSDHRIIRVDFQLYVARVTSSEWNTVPEQLRLAGAVAVKQYAWWKAMHPRPSKAGCFDVWDSTRDQIYRHHKTPPAHVWSAVRATWSWRVLRDGRLIHAGYRTGRPRRCAADVDGYHLFARSASRCANAGWSARRILEVYYRGRVVR